MFRKKCIIQKIILFVNLKIIFITFFFYFLNFITNFWKSIAVETKLNLFLKTEKETTLFFVKFTVQKVLDIPYPWLRYGPVILLSAENVICRISSRLKFCFHEVNAFRSEVK